MQNVPLEKVFKEIKKQAGFLFLYNNEEIEKVGRVSVNVRDADIRTVMAVALASTGFTYRITDKTIVLIPMNENGIGEKEEVLTPSPVLTIGGRVTDARTGEPIVGATILVKGTKYGTSSNLQGRFIINIESGKILVISFVGYETEEILITGAASLDVKLTITTESMKDIVVTGRFTRKASTNTGTISSFSQEELLKAGTMNVIQSLKNLEPAFFIPENNAAGSNPNVLPDIQVRGQTGLPDIKGEYLSNPNNPLFILDGIPVSLQTIIDLDINRIKSATILLDAASKAIYGSRAANGVLIIETTVPRSGKILISYNANLTFNAADLSSYNLTNAREKLEVEVAAGLYNSANNSGPNSYLLRQIYNAYLSNVVAGVNTDWLNKPVRNGLGQQHSVSFEGGESAGMRYQATLRLNNVMGVMKGSDRNTFTGMLKLAYRIRSLNFTNTLIINNNKANNSSWGSFSQYALMNPYLPYLNEFGQIVKTFPNIVRQNGVAGAAIGAPFGSLINENVFNPAYNSTLSVIDASNYTQYINNFNIDWLITPEFRVNGLFGFTKELSQGDQFFPADHTMFSTAEFTGDNAFRKGRYTRTNGTSQSYAGNLTLSYGKLINKHSITVNLPVGISEIRSNNLGFIVEGFPNDRLNDPSGGLQYSTAFSNRPFGNESHIRRVEASLTANYGYDERLFAEFTAGKSKGTDSGPEVPWSVNWSVGLGWNLHNQAYFKSMKFINLLRFSINTGYTGADGFSSFDHLPSYTFINNNSYYVFGNGAVLARLANPQLKPQRTQEHGFEMRVGLFKKLAARFSYYIRNTKGLMTYVTAPPSTGFLDYKANIGRSQNKGFNANVNFTILSNSKERNSLNVFAGVSHNTNRLIEVSNSFKLYNQTQDATVSKSPRSRYIEGQSLTTIWAVPSLGIDPATGKEVYRKKDGTQTYTWSADDQVAAGDALPKFNGNFGFRMEIKGVEVTAIFNYWLGGQQYNQTLVDRVENADVYKNVDRRVFSDRWRQPGDHSHFKNIADFSITQASTRFVEDRNTLTLGAIDIGYDLFRMVKAIRKMGFSKFRVGLNASDVFVISTISTERGINYPFARNFAFTLNTSF